MNTHTACPYCQRDAFDEADESCDACGFHRTCCYCGTTISDQEAATLNIPKACTDPACHRQYWDEANIAWTDNL